MNNDPLRKCDTCKITKPKSLFYRYKYCKRCHIKDYLIQHICNARVANHLNLSIDELNNIIKIEIDINDHARDEIGEHNRYGEVMFYLNRKYMSNIITNDNIDNFLDENF